MNTLESIHGRRSVRKFKAEKVDRETIEKIVAAAAYAPSWKNTQVTRYHVFDNQEIKSTIANKYTLGFSYNTGTIEAAPQVVAIISAAEAGRAVGSPLSFRASRAAARSSKVCQLGAVR